MLLKALNLEARIFTFPYNYTFILKKLTSWEHSYSKSEELQTKQHPCDASFAVNPRQRDASNKNPRENIS